MTRRGMIMSLAAVAAATLTGCGTSSMSYRYRMRVEGAYSGTAVYEMLAEKHWGLRLPDEKMGGSIIEGEALVIETPSGPVFVLLHPEGGGSDLQGAVTRALTPDIPWNGQPNFWKAVTRLAHASSGEVKATLPREEWPMMVRFRDVSDPKTVESVDPDTIGAKRITLETTRDPVTIGIEKRLIWLHDEGQPLDSSGPHFSATPPLAQTLYQRTFSTEIGK